MKSKKIRIFIILAIPVLLAAGICAWAFTRQKLDYLEFSELPARIAFDYDQASFYRAIDKYPKKHGGLAVSGIISPHHDTAAGYTAELFQKIDGFKIERVIIVGPNHENKGAGDILAAPISYTYFGGTVHSDSLVEKMIRDNMAARDASVFKTEHSIYNIVPYVHYYFPEAKIVPIALSADVGKQQAQGLGKYLSRQMDEGTLLIASIDFSHYLDSEQARVKDLSTKEALMVRDYDKLYSLNSDYLDSPAAAVVILSAIESEAEIIRNANSADALGIGSIPVSTSYFTILFRRQ